MISVGSTLWLSATPTRSSSLASVTAFDGRHATVHLDDGTTTDIDTEKSGYSVVLTGEASFKARRGPYRLHSGERIEIISLLNPYERDTDSVGLLYNVRFQDGSEGVASEDELIHTDKGKQYDEEETATITAFLDLYCHDCPYDKDCQDRAGSVCRIIDLFSYLYDMGTEIDD